MVDSNKLLAISLGAALLAKKKAAKGEPGLQGDAGERGLQGETGERGLIGEVGIQGEPGPKGDKGDSGDAGPMGPRGEKGDKGDKGEQGDIGPRGEKGDTGPKGDKGGKGDTGSRGDKGDKGEQGDIGPMPKHKWDETYLKFEIKPGEYGKAVDLRGPQGPVGAQGPRGAGGISLITSTDGSIAVTSDGPTVNLQVSQSTPASTLLAQVRNETGSTLLKGTAVYISGAAGNKATVSKALATSDATCAQTLGLITANIPNNQNGYATVFGQLVGLDTEIYAEGTQLYLSSTVAGSYTNVKQFAPNHLVYIGVVTRSHQNQGAIEVKIQNGYELDEIHDVLIDAPANGEVLTYDSSTGLWKNLPASGGGGGGGSGTVTSVALSAPSGFTVSGSPVTSTGTLALSFATGYSLPGNTTQGTWTTAYSWGNHASAGYLTSFTETDPVFVASPAHGITSTNITNWTTAYGWGNHASAGYLTSFTESDPIFVASPAYGVTSTNITHWNTAYGWGNHASAGYLTSLTESDPIFTASVAYGILSTDLTHWNAAYGWGNHASAGYLTSFTETDPVFVASPAYAITSTNITNWNSAYGWGNHASAGYLTSISSGMVTTALGFTPEPANVNLAKYNDATAHFSGNMQIDGNLTVSGTTVTINATNLAVEDNMIYLNNGSAVANPDLGVVGNYNDGTYRHAGIFRDATDGRWKIFKNYTPEPDASAYIDTAHASFALADFQANTFIGSLTGNADTVTNGVYSNGSYADPTWLTSIAGSKVSGNITGNAANITGTYGGSLTSLQVTNGLGFTPYNATNPAGYISSYTETDPVFVASPAHGITGTNITNWNSAYGWGNHASAGYLTSFTETDPVFIASPAYGITGTNITNWTTAYGWGNHASAGYLTSFTETDPIFVASAAHGITGTNITNWNTAFGWGNHASAGYLTSGAIGSTVQAYDADLTSWAAIAPSTKQDTLVSATNIKTINGATILGSGDLTVSGSFAGGTLTSPLVYTAGTATNGTEPAKFQSGTVTTIPAAGSMEYDGVTLFATPQAGNRGVIPSIHYITLTGTYTTPTGTANTLKQLFNSTTNGALTVAGNTTYFFECLFNVTAMSATSGTLQFGFLGTATFSSILYMAIANKTASGVQTASSHTLGTAKTAVIITAANTTTTGYAFIKGKITVTTGGTIIPAFALSVAAPAVVQNGAYFRCFEAGLNTEVEIGAWT